MNFLAFEYSAASVRRFKRLATHLEAFHAIAGLVGIIGNTYAP